jgi:hypothetical protein
VRLFHRQSLKRSTQGSFVWSLNNFVKTMGNTVYVHVCAGSAFVLVIVCDCACMCVCVCVVLVHARRSITGRCLHRGTASQLQTSPETGPGRSTGSPGNQSIVPINWYAQSVRQQRNTYLHTRNRMWKRIFRLRRFLGCMRLISSIVWVQPTALL